MFKLLNNFSIGLRLTLGFSVVVLMTFLVGAVALVTTNVRDAAQQEANTAEHIQTLSDQIEIELLQARRREKDFLLRWQSEGFQEAYDNYVILNQQHMQEIRSHVTELRALVGDEVTLTALSQIEQATQTYDTLFAEVVSKLSQRGHIDTGLEGEFRDAVHALEESAIFTANLELQVTQLQMRRNEKDYLLRGLQEDIDDTSAFNTQLQQQIAALDISESEKDTLIVLASTYLTDFNGLVELDREIALTTDEFRTAAQSIEPLVEQIQTSATALENEATAASIAAENLGQQVNATLLVVATVVGIGLAVIIRLSIVGPIVRIVNVAEAIAEGDLSKRVEATSSDEIGAMGRTINTMADELQGLIGTLEERIAVRTRDLQTVADVNRQISTILDADRLLQDVVDLTKERFRLYHSHIYLVDESGETLVLTSGAGHVGRKMVSEGRTIARDNQQSIVARSATTRKFVTVQDVTQSPTFLPHPLLPDTRSELAVPLVARGQLLGVLDVQSDVVNYFDGDVIGVIEILADQVASALSNAQLYEVAERTSRHERALGNFDRHIQGASDVDEILQVAVRELGKALRVPHTAIELRVNSESEPDAAANGGLDYRAN